MTEAHIAGFFFFAMIANDMYHSEGPGTYVGWILAALFLVLTLTAQFWYFFIKYLTSHKELRNTWEVAFSAEGVHIKTSDVHFFNAWCNFKKASEAMRCFLVYINSSMYYMFPKRCVPVQQQTTFRELLRTKLASEDT
jgi:hypothetical protein